MIKQRLLLAVRIWITANMLYTVGAFVFTMMVIRFGIVFFLSAVVGGLLCSLPIACALFLSIPIIIRTSESPELFFRNCLMALLICSLFYTLGTAVLISPGPYSKPDFFRSWVQISSLVGVVVAVISFLSL